MASTLKRVSIVCYPESCDIENALLYFKDILEQYAYILHDKDITSDGELKKPHYHLFMEFSKPVNTNTICNRFNCSTYESVRNKNGVIQYMTHKRYKDKVEYSWKDIKAFNIDVETICERIQLCDNNETETLVYIFAYCKAYQPTINELTEWVINEGYYYTYRSNYQIIKEYLKSVFMNRNKNKVEEF